MSEAERPEGLNERSEAEGLNERGEAEGLNERGEADMLNERGETQTTQGKAKDEFIWLHKDEEVEKRLEELQTRVERSETESETKAERSETESETKSKAETKTISVIATYWSKKVDEFLCFCLRCCSSSLVYLRIEGSTTFKNTLPVNLQNVLPSLLFASCLRSINIILSSFVDPSIPNGPRPASSASNYAAYCSSPPSSPTFVFDSLGDFLLGTKTLRDLSLCTRKQGEEFGDYFYSCLAQNSTLTSIDLAGFFLPSTKVMLLPKTVVDLDISGCHTPNETTYNILRSNFSLQQISVYGVNCEEPFYHELFNTCYPSLVDVTLVEPEHMCPLGPSMFLSANPQLVDLSLSEGRLGDEGVSLLAKTLRNNCRLKRLDIERNCVRQSGFLAIAEMLETNSWLKSLYMDQDMAIDPTWIQAIAKGILKNKRSSIRVLCVRGYGRGYHDNKTRKLLEKLVSRRHMSTLCTDCFGITFSPFNTTIKTLQHTGHAHELLLQRNTALRYYKMPKECLIGLVVDVSSLKLPIYVSVDMVLWFCALDMAEIERQKMGEKQYIGAYGFFKHHAASKISTRTLIALFQHFVDREK